MKSSIQHDFPAAKQPLFRKQDWAYVQLREWILEGQLAPSERLDETRLAATLQLSRIPLRQALARLAAEGLIIDRPHHGWIIPELSLDQAEDVYSGRVALEVMLASEATRRADNGDKARVGEALSAQKEHVAAGNLTKSRDRDKDFHFTMYEIAGRPRSLAALEMLRSLSERYIYLYMSEPERLTASVIAHGAIYRAFKDGDVDEVAALTKSHINEGIVVLRTLLANK